MKIRPWIISLMACLAVIAVSSVLLYMQTPLLESFEASTYDLRFSAMRGALKPHPDIAIVAIDDKSIEEMGRFPWSRENYAYLMDALKKAGAKALLMDAFFPEPQNKKADSAFAAAMKRSGNVTLASAVDFNEDGSMGGITISIEPLTNAAKRTAQINFFPDPDGVNRWTPLIVRYEGFDLPSLGLAGAMELMGTDEFEVRDFEVRVGGKGIPTDSEHLMLIDYTGGPGTYDTIPFVDIIKGRVAPERLRGKVLFMGATALGIYDMRVSPFSNNMPGVEIHADIADNIASGRFMRRSGLEAMIDLGAIFILCLIVFAVSYKSRPLVSLPITTAIIVMHVGFAHYMFLHGRWVSMVYPILGVALTYSAITYMRVFYVERRAREMRSLFSSYVSKKIVDELVRTPDAVKIGGDTKNITIMFSDVVGYTSYSEKRRPEEVVKILNEYLSAMTGVIMDHDGTLDKFLGDGIMSYWGAPLSQPDHAAMAVDCALGMRERMVELKKQWEAAGTEPLRFRVGINSGEVISGNIGASGKKMEYTVIGDNVNLASRIEGTGKVYGVGAIVSENTYSLTKDRFIFRELDNIKVVGKNKPIKIYELMGRNSGPADAGLAERISKFHDALELYRHQKWDDALRILSDLMQKYPEDPVPVVFQKRCELYKSNPPSPEWDGVYERRGK